MEMNECKFSVPKGYYDQLRELNNIEFTNREIDVLACIIHVRGSAKIASIFNISPRTCETHIANIKRKIDKTARENVIDFVQKSGKTTIIRRHYEHLMVQNEFQKKLVAISKLTNCKTKTCLIICSEQQKSLGKLLMADFAVLGIKTIVNYNDGSKLNKAYLQTSKYIVYLISQDLRDTPQPINNHLKTVSVLLATSEIPEWLKTTNYIDAEKLDSYYFLVLELLKILIPNSHIKQIVNEFKSSYYHNDNKKANTEAFLANSEKKLPPATISVKNRPQRLPLVVVTIIISAVLLYYFTSPKELGQVAPEETSIISYIPEILTGYEKFIGRKKELQQIEQAFANDNVVILTGLSGVGKSSLAIEYGKLQKPNKIVRYFNADSAIKIDQKYKELAQELHIYAKQQPKHLVMQRVNSKISNINTGILFIFDKVDDYNIIKDYINNLPPNVKVIITTKLPKLIADKPHIVIEEFNLNEVEEYLHSTLKNRSLTSGNIQELISNFGTLPYDLKCMVAYLLDNPAIDNETIAKAIAKELKDKLFQEFAISKDKVKQQAWKLLQYIAHLDPDFINIELLKALFPRNETLMLNAVKKLESLSLIAIVNNQNQQRGIKIHRKLQRSVQRSAEHHPKHSLSVEILRNRLLFALDKLFPKVEWTQPLPPEGGRL